MMMFYLVFVKVPKTQKKYFLFTMIFFNFDFPFYCELFSSVLNYTLKLYLDWYTL